MNWPVSLAARLNFCPIHARRPRPRSGSNSHIADAPIAKAARLAPVAAAMGVALLRRRWNGIIDETLPRTSEKSGRYDPAEERNPLVALPAARRASSAVSPALRTLFRIFGAVAAI